MEVMDPKSFKVADKKTYTDTVCTTTTFHFDFWDTVKMLFRFRMSFMHYTEITFHIEDGKLTNVTSKDPQKDRLWFWHPWKRNKPVTLQNGEGYEDRTAGRT